MQVYTFATKFGNFGDDLNELIWPVVAPGLLRREVAGTLVGVGSVLCREFAGSVAGPKLVCGAGYAYGTPLRDCGETTISWVRGPLTAAKLGLGANAALLDGAYLVRELSAGAPPRRRDGIGFMPHHESCPGIGWNRLCVGAGLRFLDPTAAPARVLAEIRDCSLVVSEAMHGCIVADALGIPWVPCRIFPGVNRLKWEDWTRSLKLPYRPFCGSGCRLPLWIATCSAVRALMARLFVRKLVRNLGRLERFRSDETNVGPLYREMRRRLAGTCEQLADAPALP